MKVNGNSNSEKNKDWKRFMQVAHNLKVVATKDNTIQVASTMFHWSELWSEQLESTPVFASLSDSVSGHTHNIQLWSDEDQKDQHQVSYNTSMNQRINISPSTSTSSSSSSLLCL